MSALLLAVVWFAAIATSAFPLVYCAVAPWWRYTLGRVLFGLSLTVALIIDLSLWQSLPGQPEPAWMPLAAVLLFASLGAHMAALTFCLIRAQHRGNRQRVLYDDLTPADDGPTAEGGETMSGPKDGDEFI